MKFLASWVEKLFCWALCYIQTTPSLVEEIERQIEIDGRDKNLVNGKNETDDNVSPLYW